MIVNASHQARVTLSLPMSLDFVNQMKEESANNLILGQLSYLWVKKKSKQLRLSIYQEKASFDINRYLTEVFEMDSLNTTLMKDLDLAIKIAQWS